MMVRRSMLLTIVCCLAVLSASAVVAFRADASPRDGQSAAAVHDRADLVTVGPRATIRSSSVDLPRAPMTGVAVYAVPLAALALAGLVASHSVASTGVFRRGVLSSRAPPLLHV